MDAQGLFSEFKLPRLREAREACGWTLEELAEATGYAASTISSVENGHDNPSMRLLGEIVAALQINPAWLGSGEGEMFIAGPPASPLHNALVKRAEKLNEGSAPFGVIRDGKGARGQGKAPETSAQIPTVSEELLDLLEQVLLGKFSNASQQIKTAAAVLAEVRAALNAERSGAKCGLTSFSEVVKSPAVKEILPLLLERIRALTSASGSKGELAAHLGAPAASLSQWLAGTREPGGETTLRLLQWVERQERTQQSPDDAQNTVEAKTRSRKSVNEKPRPSPRKH